MLFFSRKPKIAEISLDFVALRRKMLVVLGQYSKEKKAHEQSNTSQADPDHVFIFTLHCTVYTYDERTAVSEPGTALLQDVPQNSATQPG
jgi:hypothetical protein